MSRRFTQILIGYVGGSWGVLQALDWSVGHYLLSKSLVDFFVDFALLMLPAVLLLAWYVGRDAHQPLHKRVVGVGVPLNIVVAAVVLFIVFHGKRLGATTEVVAVKDDNGATIERRIPKNEFRKRVLFLSLQSDGVDAKDAWLAQALPELLFEDVRQDPFIEADDSSSVSDLFHKAHLGFDSAVPLAFARQTADSRHFDFFTLGQLHKEGAQYRVRVALHAAASGHEVAHEEAVGSDVCALADQLSLALRRDFGIPAPHLESSPDLPVCDILTRSMPALAEMTAALHARFDEDLGRALPHLEKAVALDPTFASAQLLLFFIQFQSHEPEKMQRAMAATAANAYKLSEPLRFDFTATRYLLAGNYEKEGAILTNWVTLYPQSADAKQRLAQHYERLDRRAEAVALYEQALELNPASTALTNQLAELHMQRGEVEPAVAVYRRFLAQFPNDADMNVQLARQLRIAGRFAEAKAADERALAIDVDNVNATLGLLNLRYLQGERDAGIAGTQKLLADVKLPQDRRAIYYTLKSHYEDRGQIQLALQTFLAMRRELDPMSLSLQNDRVRLEEARLFVLAGHRDELAQLMKRNDNSPTMKENPNLRIAMQEAQLDLDDTLDDAKGLAQHLPPFVASLREFGLEQARTLTLYYEARRKEIEHDWANAKTTWQELERLDWSSDKAAIGVGRCQRMLGDLDGAHAQLTKATARFVGEPTGYYELALTDRARDPAAAKRALATALAIWAPADADYQPAQAARTLAASLGGVSSK